jgi:sec-independent protein translocase protein TatA
MGLSNPIHLMFVAVIALLVLGPKRLPEVARSVGSSVKAFRGSLTGDEEPAVVMSNVPPSVPATNNDHEA